MDFVDIGRECFASKDLKVISYKGDNYYKACGVIVKTTRYGTTSCVKRVDHPGEIHEDYDGNLLNEDKEIKVGDVGTRIVTTKGVYVVGEECGVHKRRHSSHGWYVCIPEGGIVDGAGYHTPDELPVD